MGMGGDREHVGEGQGRGERNEDGVSERNGWKEGGRREMVVVIEKKMDDDYWHFLCWWFYLANGFFFPFCDVACLRCMFAG